MGIDLSTLRPGYFIIYDGEDYVYELLDVEDNMIHLRSQVDGTQRLVPISEADDMYEAFFPREDREK